VFDVRARLDELAGRFEGSSEVRVVENNFSPDVDWKDIRGAEVPDKRRGYEETIKAYVSALAQSFLGHTLERYTISRGTTCQREVMDVL